MARRQRDLGAWSDTMSDERLTDIEVALAYDRRLIEDLNDALVDANKTIAILAARLKRLEDMLAAVSEQVHGLPPNEKPPHY